MGDTTIAPPLIEVVSPVRSGVGCLSEILDYIERLRRQVPEVERLRDQGRARGDLTAVRNAEHLLAQWAVLISTNTPANDLGPSHQQRLPAQMLPARDIAEAEQAANDPRQARPRRAASLLFSDLSELLKRNVGGLWLAFRDARTPWYAKAIAVLACLLAVSPVDFTPDRIPHVGYLDDPTILILGTLLAAQLISPLLIAEFRERAASVEHARAVRGSFALCSIWLAAILVTMLHVWRPVV
jgi:uncharacterized membrane protein YkvA (DUF1232 family)